MSFANSFKKPYLIQLGEILNLLKAGRLSAGEIASQFELNQCNYFTPSHDFESSGFDS